MKLDPEIVARGWIELQCLSGKSTEHYLGSWADDVLRAAIECDADYAWSIIEKIHELDPEQRHADTLAAGPLEDLLCWHGDRVVDSIVQKARQDPKFKHVLSGIWKSQISDTAWGRISALAAEL